MTKTTIDLPDDLVIEVKRIAKEQGRSMRKQVIHWLQFAVERYRSRQVRTWYYADFECVDFEEEE